MYLILILICLLFLFLGAFISGGLGPALLITSVISILILMFVYLVNNV